ncbi:ABC transporter ATP-binding protein [uncultured Gammaproteobacteria bacterium]
MFNRTILLNLLRDVRFMIDCMSLLRYRWILFTLFIILALASALTEGIGLALLMPILKGTSAGLERLPVLGAALSGFEAMDFNSRIRALAVVLAAVVVARGLLELSSTTLATNLPVQFQKALADKVFTGLLYVDLRFIQGNDVGTLMANLNSYPVAVAEIAKNLGFLVINLLLMGVYGALMFMVSGSAMAATATFILIMTLIMRVFALRQLALGRTLTTSAGQYGQVCIEGLTSMPQVRLADGEQRMHELFRSRQQAYYSSLRRMNFLTNLNHPMFTSCGGLFIVLLLLLGTILFQREDDWTDMMLLFLIVLYRLMGPATAVSAIRLAIMAQYPGFRALQETITVLDATRPQNGSLVFHALTEAVRLEDVTFCYDPNKGAALRGLTVEFPAGKMTAVVGPSGAGKSTIVSLLARLYDPGEGRVTVDGVDLREFDLRTWRQRVGVVAQDVVLFNDSVFNNLRFARPDATRTEIEAAVELADAAEFIESLPEGYETRIGDRGVMLSGGQKQRLAIARAVLVQPEILILDEATSNLDGRTERAIQRAVDRLAKRCTVIVIAHRLATILKADCIVVIDKGSVIEQGRHDVLMRNGGVYCEMIEHQRLDIVE